jgi:DNA processing protein
MKTQNDLFFKIALSFANGIGAKTLNYLYRAFDSAESIINAPMKQLMQLDGIGSIKAHAIKNPLLLKQAEKELKFIEKNDITCIQSNDDAYPTRLLNCNDMPDLLYLKGSCNLNAKKSIAIVGTRTNTNYGKKITEQFVASLKNQADTLIVSGLALGIDTIAHQASIINQMPTVAVLAHGLHTMYPKENQKLSDEIIDSGGCLLTEFNSQSRFERGNFLSRNRIVAGISDVTVVMESDEKGGSLITAMLANSYNKEVCAFPGRSTDNKSKGTNKLIRTNIAGLVTNVDDFLDYMNWQDADKNIKTKPLQQSLFLTLTEAEVLTYKVIQEVDTIHVDDLQKLTQLSSSELAATLLQLEFNQLIEALPGKRFRKS